MHAYVQRGVATYEKTGVYTPIVPRISTLVLFIDVLYYWPQDQRTALHHASECGHHHIVERLLREGADPNARDKVSGM